MENLLAQPEIPQTVGSAVTNAIWDKSVNQVLAQQELEVQTVTVILLTHPPMSLTAVSVAIYVLILFVNKVHV